MEFLLRGLIRKDLTTSSFSFRIFPKRPIHRGQGVKNYIDPVIEEFLKVLSPFPPEIEEIRLFGSRARGDWRPDSDYDLLVLVKKKDRALMDALYEAVLDVLLRTGKLISLKVFTMSQFSRFLELSSPFARRVSEEGIRIA